MSKFTYNKSISVSFCTNASNCHFKEIDLFYLIINFFINNNLKLL